MFTDQEPNQSESQDFNRKKRNFLIPAKQRSLSLTDLDISSPLSTSPPKKFIKTQVQDYDFLEKISNLRQSISEVDSENSYCDPKRDQTLRRSVKHLEENLAELKLAQQNYDIQNYQSELTALHNTIEKLKAENAAYPKIQSIKDKAENLFSVSPQLQMFFNVLYNNLEAKLYSIKSAAGGVTRIQSSGALDDCMRAANFFKFLFGFVPVIGGTMANTAEFSAELLEYASEEKQMKKIMEISEVLGTIHQAKQWFLDIAIRLTEVYQNPIQKLTVDSVKDLARYFSTQILAALVDKKINFNQPEIKKQFLQIFTENPKHINKIRGMYHKILNKNQVQTLESNQWAIEHILVKSDIVDEEGNLYSLKKTPSKYGYRAASIFDLEHSAYTFIQHVNPAGLVFMDHDMISPRKQIIASQSHTPESNKTLRRNLRRLSVHYEQLEEKNNKTEKKLARVSKCWEETQQKLDSLTNELNQLKNDKNLKENKNRSRSLITPREAKVTETTNSPPKVHSLASFFKATFKKKNRSNTQTERPKSLNENETNENNEMHETHGIHENSCYF